MRRGAMFKTNDMNLDEFHALIKFFKEMPMSKHLSV